MIKITDESFDQEVINSDKVVVADFYADWCMPCRMLAPVLEKLEAEFGDKVSFVKIDTDEHRAKATELRISALPTLLVYKAGEKVRTFVGLVKENDLRTALSDLTRDGE